MDPAATSPRPDIKADLVTLARRQGFLDCRVTRALPHPRAHLLLPWLAQGRAGEMTWLERTSQKRRDPRLVLPDARAIVVLAMNYWQGPPPPGAPRIARYAWGDDYHRLLLDRLRPLGALLHERGGTQLLYADTGPVAETEYAERAGAGWKGKHNLAIHPSASGWILLGTILTTLPLDPDPPIPPRCGRCSRCIDACPTGALLAPHELDPRICIAYLTVECRGPIPTPLRPLVGDRIFGCDDCLDACPWNRFAQVSREAAFQMRPALAALRPRDLLQLDPQTFLDLTRNSPIRRLRLPRLRRNAAVALGNVGTRNDLPALHAAEHDPDPLVAEHAAWATSEIETRTNRRARD